MPHSKDKFQSKHIVFVDGLLNEAAQLVGNYFCDNISEVGELGINHSHIGYISNVPVPENAEKLFIDIHKIYKKENLPLILVGHSKGGAECLYCVLKYPELLLSGLIDRVVLIHPAIGGSPLAYRVSNNIAGRSFTKYLGEGLVSLRPDVSKKNFDKVFESFRRIVASVSKSQSATSSDSQSITSDDSDLCSLTDEVFKKCSDRIFYIRGKSPAASICWGVRFVVYFCKAPLDPMIPNDGLLHVQDQIYDNFGIDLGIIDSDHIDLVIGGMVTNASKDKRKAFTRAFMAAIYQSELLEGVSESDMIASNNSGSFVKRGIEMEKSSKTVSSGDDMC